MPKTTQNLFKDYFSNIIQKVILFSPSFFEKKVSLTPFEISYAPSLVYKFSKSFTMTVLKPQAEKPVKIKGAPPKAYYYTLYISIY